MTPTAGTLMRNQHEGDTVAHLPPPAGEPHPDAGTIIDLIGRFADSDLPPVEIVRGLRHVLYTAELAWDQSVHHARQTDPPTQWKDLVEATGDALGTLQGRERTHLARSR